MENDKAKFIEGELSQALNLKTNEFKKVLKDIALEKNLGVTDIGAPDKINHASIHQIKPNQDKSIFSPTRKWLAAASILLLIGVGYFMLKPPDQANTNLFADNFSPYLNTVTMRASTKQTPLTRAMTKYDLQDYSAAVQIFNQIEDGQKSDTVLFYQGISEIALSDLAGSANHLSKINTSSIYFVQSKWYLAMAHLKANQHEKAKEVLRQITELPKADIYENKAQQILEKLD